MTAADVLDQIRALDPHERAKVLDSLLEFDASQRASDLDDEAFKVAADRVLERHAELLQKLAQ